MASSEAPQNLPHRSKAGDESEDEAVPTTDPSNTSSLLLERLRAYKHACGYLEAYINSTEKAQKAQCKEYEKVLKTVSDPLKEGHHFDTRVGGVSGLFENLRSNTQGLANLHLETEKAIKSSVLPVLERLHSEIKHKSKELSKGAAKGSKEVDKTRAATQKHIELLGQHAAASSTSAGKIDTPNDPYILRRGVQHRLHRQVQEENNNRADLLAVQDSFSQFEAHVLATMTQALVAFNQTIASQCDRQRQLYGDVVTTAQKIPPDFEWRGFVARNNNTLIDPSVPQRTVSNIAFPNQDHSSTQEIISGSLERKSRAVIKGYSSGYYAVTPAGYLHEFRTDDIVAKDPTPELSLYLPDCVVGSLEGNSFSIKGKDASKGKVGSVMTMSHDMTFRASTPAEAEKWFSALRAAAGDHSAATHQTISHQDSATSKASGGAASVNSSSQNQSSTTSHAASQQTANNSTETNVPRETSLNKPGNAQDGPVQVPSDAAGLAEARGENVAGDTASHENSTQSGVAGMPGQY